jgi:formylglycine-generating enzyme required for sulfatase activity
LDRIKIDHHRKRFSIMDRRLATVRLRRLGAIALTVSLSWLPALTPAEEAGSMSTDAPAKGALGIRTLPGGAELTVDGQAKGLSPRDAQESLVLRLPEGEHLIRAEKEGFEPVERSVYVAADSERTVRLDLAPHIDMVRIDGGCFMMGSPEDEPERDADEGPQHEVCVEPFEIGRHEVTFADWDACVADGGCAETPDDEGWGRDRRPVVNVSWQEAREYIRWLNGKGGLSGFRLPSEAEWEYAARAGTTTPFATGDCVSTDQANFDGTFEYGNCPPPTQVDLHQTQPVGSYDPNPWGLYDMHGNVNEFVADCWNSGYDGAPTDGSAWEDGNCTRRVLRGGSWHGYPGYLRSAYRCRSGPAFGHRTIGFRLARSMVGDEPVRMPDVTAERRGR